MVLSPSFLSSFPPSSLPSFLLPFLPSSFFPSFLLHPFPLPPSSFFLHPASFILLPASFLLPFFFLSSSFFLPFLLPSSFLLTSCFMFIIVNRNEKLEVININYLINITFQIEFNNALNWSKLRWSNQDSTSETPSYSIVKIQSKMFKK